VPPAGGSRECSSRTAIGGVARPDRDPCVVTLQCWKQERYISAVRKRGTWRATLRENDGFTDAPLSRHTLMHNARASELGAVTFAQACPGGIFSKREIGLYLISPDLPVGVFWRAKSSAG